MNLTTIHHYENHGSQTTVRESSYHVTRNDGPLVTVRVKVHKDRSYARQGWARLDLWTESDFVELFTAEQNLVFRAEPWEVENHLLESFGKFLHVPFSHFDSEAALVESGHLEQPRS